MQHSPNTWQQESFTGYSGASSLGNPWSTGSVPSVPPLSVPYSILQIEQCASSVSSVVISTRTKVCTKSSTWLGENWMPPLPSLSSSASRPISPTPKLANAFAAYCSKALHSLNKSRDSCTRVRAVPFMLVSMSFNSSGVGKIAASPLASRCMHCGVYSDCVWAPSDLDPSRLRMDTTWWTIRDQTLSASEGGPRLATG